VLLAAAVAALVLANTGLGDTVERFWERELTLIDFGGFHLVESLRDWINDGLMTIFFFVVGLEIKRELVTGELRDPRRAALPAIAAVGGMVVPAVLYAVFNAGGAGSAGWGIPMATDIAFVVGVLALLGKRVPTGLKVFVLTLAIVDDIGAIIVIAIFYTERLSIGWLTIAVAAVALIILMRLGHVWYVPAYLVVGLIVWFATLESGVHATIAGVTLGLLAPAIPFRPSPTRVEIDPKSSFAELRSTLFDARESIPVAERLQNIVHPWSAFIILPLFAFANAGIELSSGLIAEAMASPVTWGIIAGLVVGKPLGIAKPKEDFEAPLILDPTEPLHKGI
jgi:NhaA family Na+:H+ antiporter